MKMKPRSTKRPTMVIEPYDEQNDEVCLEALALLSNPRCPRQPLVADTGPTRDRDSQPTSDVIAAIDEDAQS